MGQYDLALADFHPTILLDPNIATAYNNRAIAYEGLKQYQLAINDYNTAIFISNQFSSAYHNRADLYFKLKDYPRALLDVTSAIRLEPDQGASHALQARAYMALGREQEAKAAARGAVDLGYDAQVLESALRELAPPKVPQQQSHS